MSEYRTLAARSNAGMFICKDETFTFVNDAFVRVFGYASADAFLKQAHTLSSLLSETDYKHISQEIHLYADASDQHPVAPIKEINMLLEVRNVDGEKVYLDTVMQVSREDGQIVLLGTAINVTQTVVNEMQMTLSEQRYRSLFEHNFNATFSINASGHLESMNAAAVFVIGYTREELAKTPIHSLIYPDDLPKAIAKFRKVRDEGINCSFELRMFHKSGEIKHLQVVNLPEVVNGRIAGVYGIAKDVTRKKRYIEQMKTLVFTDPLTGLKNKQYFEKQASSLQIAGKKCAVAMIDISGFNSINTAHGHEIGDAVLRRFSKMLQHFTKSSAMIAFRYGSDVFAVLSEHDTLEPLVSACQDILEFLNEPIQIGEHDFFLSVSIGVSEVISGDYKVAELIRQADIARHHAKEKRGHALSVYSTRYDLEIYEKSLLVKDMRKAIAKNQFYLEYQPRVNRQAGKVTGVEALLRWAHPVRGIVSPGEFIPIAEQTGMIIELGRWALRRAIQETRPLVEKLNIRLSVNISVMQIMNQHFIRDLKDILDESGFNPRKLELEITESTRSHKEKVMEDFLKAIKKLQLSVSLDDFGAGYSGMNFIQKHEIGTVKLDRTFIRFVMESDRNKKIFSSIVSLMRSLNIQIVAEGIETVEQLHYIEENECHEAQGFLFSAPVPLQQLEETIHRIDSIMLKPQSQLG